MSQRISHRERQHDGWLITLETENAFNAGGASPTSRFETIKVPFEAARGKTPEELHQLVMDMTGDDPFGAVVGAVVAAPTQTKAIHEARMVALYETWQRWQNTRLEAAAQGLAAAVITALKNREDAAWAAYVQVIQSWRSAP
jgi:hypothetical protein